MAGEVRDTPTWFLEALAAPRRDGVVAVSGCPVHYLQWGDPELPALLLVHGGGGHAHWWTHLAPLLAREYHVVAPDLSGHGGSGRRDSYPREGWADEVLAVAHDAGVRGRPVLVGHSMGGLVCVMAAAIHAGEVDGLVMVDTPVRGPDPESAEAKARRRALRSSRVYPDLETAVSRFRLVPPQPCDSPWLLDHIARTSVTACEGGWTWRFDPVIYRDYFPQGVHEELARVTCRVALFRGEFSVSVTPETRDYMLGVLAPHRDRSAGTVPAVVSIEIPDAHHHLILDQPLAFVAALRAVLSAWDHTGDGGR